MANKRAILIVDDVELNRAILHDMFSTSYEIYEAANGAEALRMLEQHHDEIVIMLLDTVMPGMDGIGVLSSAQEKGYLQFFPVILMVSEDSDEMIEQGLEIGVIDIVTKPFRPGIVHHCIENAIELFRRRSDTDALFKEQYESVMDEAEKTHNFNLFLIDTLAAAIEFRDTVEGKRNPRMRGITYMILRELSSMYPELGLTKAQIYQISLASVMHDIGKVGIPDYILKKPSRLTPEEYEIIKTHTTCGAALINNVLDSHGYGQSLYYGEICLYHHERWDGLGYPNGLVGDEIPLSAQVVGVADCYDALVSDRFYQKACSSKTAIKMILDGECGKFSPMLLNALAHASQHLAGVDKFVMQTEKMANKYFIEKVTNRQQVLSDRAVRLIETERARYSKLMELSNEIIFTYYNDSDTIELSDRFLRTFGADAARVSDAIDVRQNERIFSEDRQPLFEMFNSLSSENPSFAQEIRYTTQDRENEWYSLRVNSFWDIDDPTHCIMIIGRFRNIDNFKREILLWKNQANADALTGLFNRYGLTAAVDRLTNEGCKKQRFALIMLDIDNFKQVNDTHGHIFGDKVLKNVAEILRETMRTTDFIARIGGDEFVFIMRDVATADAVILKSEEVRAHIARYSKETNIGISASIGIAFYPINGDKFHVLLEKADKALYTAKQSGKDAVKVYTTAMEAKDYISMISKLDC